MLPLFLVLSPLVQLSQAASTNATECPPCDATSCSYRSLWSILATCALTLLVCTWNAVYPNIIAGKRWYTVPLYRGVLGLVALLTPEITTMRAYSEWKNAGDIQREFRDRPWTWTRTHGFFALMGGFVLQDGAKRTAFESRYDPERLLKTKKIMNPRIEKEQISGRSKSDGLGNTILVLQLSWFILQVVARAANKLAITLLEIDTLALATLSIPLFFFWWSKPMAPESHHIFYTSTASQDAAERTSSPDEEPFLNMDDDFPISRSAIDWAEEIFGKETSDGTDFWVLLIVWVIFGGLHLIAWDFQFPTQAEKIIWRVASFALIAAPCFVFLAEKMNMADNLAYGLIGVGVVARLLLLVLMLASLRDLPATAYQTVSWTTYVPHL